MVSVNRPRDSVAFWVCTSRRRGFIIRSYECLTSTSFWPMDVNSLDGNASDSSVLDAHPLAPGFVREAMCNLLRSRPAIPVRTILGIGTDNLLRRQEPSHIKLRFT